MIARPILAALDWLAVRLLAFALRHGADPNELRQAVMSAYRHQAPAKAQALAASKLHRAAVRNQVRAVARPYR